MEEFTLKEMIKELREDMKTALDSQARHETLLEGILKQAEKTNGRVTSLEDKQSQTTTRVSMISAGIGLIVTPIISIVINQIFK